jgi:hypothetical protein
MTFYIHDRVYAGSSRALMGWWASGPGIFLSEMQVVKYN